MTRALAESLYTRRIDEATLQLEAAIRHLQFVTGYGKPTDAMLEADMTLFAAMDRLWPERENNPKK